MTTENQTTETVAPLSLPQKHAGDTFATLLAIVSLFIVCSKPILDFFWATKFPLSEWLPGLHFHHDPNIQGAAAILILICGVLSALWIARKRDSSSKQLKVLASIFFLLSIHFQIRISDSAWAKDWFLKYWSSAAGWLAIPWAIQTLSLRHAKWIRGAIGLALASVIAVLASLVAQLVGWIGWDRVDTFHIIGNVGRLTGYFDHPFDVCRVLIWPFALAAICFIRGKDIRTNTLAFLCGVGIQFFLLRTTHRTSLILSVAIPIALGFGMRKPVRGFAFVLAILLGWGLWGFSPIYRPYVFGIFDTAHFVDAPPSTGRTGAEPPPVTYGRGRSQLWKAHWGWMLTHPASSWYFGPKDTIPPEVAYPEPHNQWLDLLETCGLAGILIWIIYLIQGASFRFSLSWPQRMPEAFAASLIVFWYCIPLEPLAAPTFVWWAALFIGWPKLQAARMP